MTSFYRMSVVCRVTWSRRDVLSGSIHVQPKPRNHAEFLHQGQEWWGQVMSQGEPCLCLPAQSKSSPTLLSSKTCSTTITGASSFSRHWAARQAALRASFTWDNHLVLVSSDGVLKLGTLYWPVSTATCHCWHRCKQLSAPWGSLSAPGDQAVSPLPSSTCKKRYKKGTRTLVLWEQPGIACFHVSLSSFSLFDCLKENRSTATALHQLKLLFITCTSRIKPLFLPPRTAATAFSSSLFLLPGTRGPLALTRGTPLCLNWNRIKLMNLVVGVDGWITSPRKMTQWIQYKLGKQYLGKKSYTTLGIEPRTYSYPGRIGYPNYVSWVKKKVFKSWKQKFKWPLKMISRQKMKFQTQPKNAIFQNWLKTVSDFSFWKVQL